MIFWIVFSNFIVAYMFFRVGVIMSYKKTNLVLNEARRLQEKAFHHQKAAEKLIEKYEQMFNKID